MSACFAGALHLYNSYTNSIRIVYNMSSERKSVPVSLPDHLVRELDELVEEGKFGSRSGALRYGARLVVREDHMKRLHELTSE